MVAVRLWLLSAQKSRVRCLYKSLDLVLRSCALNGMTQTQHAHTDNKVTKSTWKSGERQNAKNLYSFISWYANNKMYGYILAYRKMKSGGYEEFFWLTREERKRQKQITSVWFIQQLCARLAMAEEVCICKFVCDKHQEKLLYNADMPPVTAGYCQPTRIYGVLLPQNRSHALFALILHLFLFLCWPASQYFMTVMLIKRIFLLS